MDEPNRARQVNDVLHTNNLPSAGYFAPETPQISRPDSAGFPIFTDRQDGGPFHETAHRQEAAQDPDGPEAGGIPAGVPVDLCRDCGMCTHHCQCFHVALGLADFPDIPASVEVGTAGGFYRV